MAMPRALQRIGGAAATWPGLRDWIECVIAIVFFGAFAWLIAQGQGWIGNASDVSWSVVVLPLFFPALAEEVVFRSVLLPRRKELPVAPWGPAIFALILFVCWHPLNAWLFLHAARPLFFDPLFLFVAAVLGATATVLYMRSQSLWTPVVFHAAIVAGWNLTGGPRFTWTALN